MKQDYQNEGERVERVLRQMKLEFNLRAWGPQGRQTCAGSHAQ